MKSNKIRVLPGEPQDGCLDQSYFRYRLFLVTDNFKRREKRLLEGP
jgi:hypothetical protein